MSDSAKVSRTPRSVEKREQETRPQTWSPPNMLPDPLPKDGYTFKWVRISTQGQDDPMNYSKKLREGWEPVPLAEAPEMEHLVLDPNPGSKGMLRSVDCFFAGCPKAWQSNGTSTIAVSLKRRCVLLITR